MRSEPKILEAKDFTIGLVVEFHPSSAVPKQLADTAFRVHLVRYEGWKTFPGYVVLEALNPKYDKNRSGWRLHTDGISVHGYCFIACPRDLSRGTSADSKYCTCVKPNLKPVCIGAGMDYLYCKDCGKEFK